MLMRCVSVSAASASDCNMARTCVTTSTLRRFRRSTHTPAKGANRNVGICPANPTTPSRNAEPVSLYTSQLVARRVIHVPISEIVCPLKNRRKLRCFSARHAKESRLLVGGAAVTAEAGGFTELHCGIGAEYLPGAKCVRCAVHAFGHSASMVGWKQFISRIFFRASG